MIKNVPALRIVVVAVLACSLVLTSSPVVAQEAAVLLKEEPVEYLGGYPGFETKDSVKGKLTITTDAIIFESSKERFEVAPELVTFVSTGEFAKRRVKGALVGAILLTPLFLFALIGKKKRGIMLIEYSDQKGKTAEGEEPKLTGAPIFRYKPKSGRAIAIEQSISRVTGLEIVDQEPEASKKSADKDDKAESKE